MTQSVQGSSQQMSDRYEPLPGIAALPGWIWRRLPRAAKIGVGLLPVVAVALALLLGPGIDRSKEERARSEAAELRQERAQRIARLRAEQRPRSGLGVPAGADLAKRAALMEDVTSTVAADARRRVAAGSLAGPIRHVQCERFPRSAQGDGAHLDPAARSGRYSCIAVTSDVPRSEASEGAIIGHPYRVKVDFISGQFGYCKVSGRPGEGSLERELLVTVPRACGGR